MKEFTIKINENIYEKLHDLALMNNLSDKGYIKVILTTNINREYKELLAKLYYN